MYAYTHIRMQTYLFMLISKRKIGLIKGSLMLVSEGLLGLLIQ